jgi:hypothetical protein
LELALIYFLFIILLYYTFIDVATRLTVIQMVFVWLDTLFYLSYGAFLRVCLAVYMVITRFSASHNKTSFPSVYCLKDVYRSFALLLIFSACPCVNNMPFAYTCPTLKIAICTHLARLSLFIANIIRITAICLLFYILMNNKWLIAHTI